MSVSVVRVPKSCQPSRAVGRALVRGSAVGFKVVAGRRVVGSKFEDRRAVRSGKARLRQGGPTARPIMPSLKGSPKQPLSPLVCGGVEGLKMSAGSGRTSSGLRVSGSFLFGWFRDDEIFQRVVAVASVVVTVLSVAAILIGYFSISNAPL